MGYGLQWSCCEDGEIGEHCNVYNNERFVVEHLQLRLLCIYSLIIQCLMHEFLLMLLLVLPNTGPLRSTAQRTRTSAEVEEAPQNHFTTQSSPPARLVFAFGYFPTILAPFVYA